MFETGLELRIKNSIFAGNWKTDFMQIDDKILNKLKEEMAEYSDEEILEILKKRSHYNQTVARFAVGEAIKRELINSEGDLMAEEYRVEPLRFRLFPVIGKAKIRGKIIKSLSRGVLLIGLIPAIYGFIKFAGNEPEEAVILWLLGFSWVISAALLMKTRHSRYIYIIMGMAALCAVYIANLFISLKGFRFMDFFVAAVVYGIIFYSLFYIKFLISGKNKQE